MQKSSMLMVCRIMFVVVTAVLFIPIFASGQNYPVTETGDQPSYPGIPPSKGPLEGTLGTYNLRIYGTVLANISASDTSVVGGDVPLWATPGSVRTAFLDGTTKRGDDVHDTIFTARQSVFGFMVKPSNPSSGGWQSSAKLEFDFFGTRP